MLAAMAPALRPVALQLSLQLRRAQQQQRAAPGSEPVLAAWPAPPCLPPLENALQVAEMF